MDYHSTRFIDKSLCRKRSRQHRSGIKEIIYLSLVISCLFRVIRHLLQNVRGDHNIAAAHALPRPVKAFLVFPDTLDSYIAIL